MSASLTTSADSAALFERSARQIYGWAYRVVGHHHDALDVVQDVFTQWTEHCREERPARPHGWMRRVTLNRACDLLRSRRVRRTADIDAAASLAGVDEDHDAEIDRGSMTEPIAAALADLTESQREVLVAKVYDRLTFAEIAAQLNVAVPTVKTHYLRAVQAMRDRLQPKWRKEYMT